MTFAFTIDVHTYENGVHILHGRFTNAGGDTGGNIATGLKRIFFCGLQYNKSSVIDNTPSVNETFPFAGSDVTIVTDDGEDGTYLIIGEG